MELEQKTQKSQETMARLAEEAATKTQELLLLQERHAKQLFAIEDDFKRNQQHSKDQYQRELGTKIYPRFRGIFHIVFMFVSMFFASIFCGWFN
jgi:hypothetical protein